MGCLVPFTRKKCMLPKPASVLDAAAIATGYVFHLRSDCDECDNFLPWLPVVDGETLPRAPVDMLSDGSHAQVPVVVSSVRNESLAFVPNILQGVTNLGPGYNKLMDFIFKDNAQDIIAHYEAAPDAAGMNFVSKLSLALTDAWFTCYGRYVARLLAKTSPTYLSTFMHAPSGGVLV